MRILVTGTEGQVARSLAEKAAAGNARHELIFAGRPQLDLAVSASIERVIADCHPDLILSVAAFTGVDDAEHNSELAMLVNGVAPGLIGRAAAAIGAPVIHISTDYVFDGGGTRPWREDDPTNPVSVYGRTKLAGERALADSGAVHAIVRTAWVYSPFGQNFVKTMLRLAQDREQIGVVADQFGNPTSALDLADALLVMADQWPRPSDEVGSIFHFAGDGAASWAEFAQEVFAGSRHRGGPTATVKGISTADYPTPARRPANSRLDCSRFAGRFDHPVKDWRQSLSETLDRLLP